MKFIVYSAENEHSVKEHFGLAEYSYYFVLKDYIPVLERLGDVVIVSDPLQQVDALYNECSALGEYCVFLTFTPPNKSFLGLACPTICVFAWEYCSIPTQSWGDDQQQDWGFVLQRQGAALTLSTHTVGVVHEAIGSDFPITSAPSPVWDRYSALYDSKAQGYIERGIDLKVQGVAVDSWAVDYTQCEPQDSPGYIANLIRQSEGDAAVIEDLRGVVYTSVFNPNDSRKNWEDLVRGFCWAFKDVEDATLILKLTYFDGQQSCTRMVDEFYKLRPFKCRVIAVHGYLDDENYARLVDSTSYIVNSAYGEGQCLPLVEFMSAGKPAIAPDHTAMMDYITDENAFVINSSMECTHWPHDPSMTKCTMRYRIDWESLYQAYLDSYAVAKNNAALYASMGKNATETQKKHCSREVVEDRLREFFAKENQKHLSALDLQNAVENKGAEGNGADSWKLRVRRAIPEPLKSTYRKIRKSTSPAVPVATPLEEPKPENELLALGDPADPRTCGLTDASLSGWYKGETNELIEGFTVGPDDVVLDVGCGEGGALMFCAKQGAHVIFSDVEERKIVELEEKISNTAARKYQGIVCDSTPLPLDGETASRVICMEMLEHVESPEDVLEELVRVGQPGALYLITVPDPVGEALQKGIAPEGYFQHPNHIRVFERDEFEKLVTGAGLEIERRTAWGFYWVMWMSFFWASEENAGRTCDGATLDKVSPPYHPLTESWAATWQKLISMPEGVKLKNKLDAHMPKSQVIIARKPL